MTTILPKLFVRMCKRRKFRSKAADSSGADLAGGSLLMRTLILRRLLLRHVLADEEKEPYVGVLMPPMVATLAVNMAVTLSRRIVVNLNYTVSSEVLNGCIAQCGITHVLTSRKFMEKMDFELDAELVYLEDLKDKPTLGDKISSALAAYLTPAALLERSLRLHEIRGDHVLTVIFTSGSEGTPKGVMLTYDNVGSNVATFEQVLRLSSSDVLVGILPFFHSFGYAITVWASAAINLKTAYHFSPLDGKVIGKLCETHGCTVLICTPTFLRTYLRRCTKEQLAALDVVITGAEKLPAELADAFEEKFSLRPVEGYGTTELSPVVSVNVPPSRSPGVFQIDRKEGTVGRPLPGVTAKTIDLDTGEDLSAGQRGMLLIKGPNVMKGYLGQPEKTAEVIRDGWYVTGDVAVVDEDGFIQITGRESRFSKIGGEMVPHIAIETALAQIIGGDEEEGLQAAVTAVPHEKKGERLIVIHLPIDLTPQQLCDGLSEAGLPNLYIPSPDSFHQVEELPLLGSGKLDLKGIRRIAKEQFAP